jgi:hypothetical protein
MFGGVAMVGPRKHRLRRSPWVPRMAARPNGIDESNFVDTDPRSSMHQRSRAQDGQVRDGVDYLLSISWKAPRLTVRHALGLCCVNIIS